MKTVLGITVYTAQETADILGVSERTLREYIKSGRLVAQKIAGDWVISEDNIKAFINGKKGAATPANIVSTSANSN